MRRSYLAGVNALYRAAESTRSTPDRILIDPFAESLSERTLRIALIRYARFLLPVLWRTIDELQTAHCVRHHVIDELILKSIEKNGVRQIVVLGAGYDMRPYRFADRVKGVKWIELDHPATQSAKTALLREFKIGAANVDRVAGDLRGESISELLTRTAFEPGLSTCFVAEGLIHYLKIQDFEQMLATAAQGPGPRRFIFSYIDSSTYSAASPTLLALVKLVREFPLLHFDSKQLTALCLGGGFTRLRSWTFDQQIAEFTPCANKRNIGASQHVALLD